LTYPTLYFKEIQVTQKIRVLPSGTLSKMLHLESFDTVASLMSAVNLSIKTTAVCCLLHLHHIELAGTANEAAS